MSKKVSAIPSGYAVITPYLIVAGAAKAIDFYEKVFGAKTRMRMDMPGGKIGHAEIDIGGSIVMLADEHPQMGAKAPGAFGGSPVSLLIYVEDVDQIFKRAQASGATIRHPIEDKFYGDRSGTVVDPYGHIWTIATHIEDVSPEEMDRRVSLKMVG